MLKGGLRYILFHHQTTTRTGSGCCCHPLRYILFHHQTTTAPLPSLVSSCCVISSFITKPQLIDCGSINPKVALYPLSSPNHNCTQVCWWWAPVALYPLSSPNHNYNRFRCCACLVALYPLSSPNHNFFGLACVLLSLRYILFHHQTTTDSTGHSFKISCVISSFITKPQLCQSFGCFWLVALYPLSSPNHNLLMIINFASSVALYPLSSPNHNLGSLYATCDPLRYILFHHQTTTLRYYWRR